MSFGNLPPFIPIHSTKPDRVTACTVAQVSRNTINKWIREGRIKVTHYGTQLVRVDTASLLQSLTSK